jgi:hypothetical protein
MTRDPPVSFFLIFPTRQDASKTSGGVHLPIKQRWLDGDQQVRVKMGDIAELVPLGVAAWRAHDWGGFALLMNRNFDLRCEVFGELAVAEEDRKAVRLARSFSSTVGAKLPGSGGCVLVLVPGSDAKQFALFSAKQGMQAEEVVLRGV